MKRWFFLFHNTMFLFYLMKGSTYTCFNNLYLFSIKRRCQRHPNQMISVSNSTYADKNQSKTFCRALYYPLVKPSVIRCCRREFGCSSSTCTATVILQTATTGRSRETVSSSLHNHDRLSLISLALSPHCVIDVASWRKDVWEVFREGKWSPR